MKLALLLAALVSGLTPRIEAQPRMEAALAHLVSAKTSLERAEHNKGGWRLAAIQGTEQAIRETKRGMAYDERHATPVGDDALALGAQPNMQSALEHLREAREKLKRAEHDKGGWRLAAIASTEAAIKETQRGMAFADAN